MDHNQVAIIGGGAAGFFAAIHVKINHPAAVVTIYEKSKKTLSKVKISGGGRCNVTNATFSIADLARNYPRGHRQLKKVFHQFDVHDTIRWFEARDVPLVTQSDRCIFPKSQNSQTIIDTFLEACKDLDIGIKTDHHLTGLKKVTNHFELHFRDKAVVASKVILTIGGQPKIKGFDCLQATGHTIIPPVPSLFTFNMPQEPVRELMGIVVDPVTTRIQGTKLVEEGPLLITHWGMSGPAILKLSAWGARILEEKKYRFNLQVNWMHHLNHDDVQAKLKAEVEKHRQKKIGNQKIVRMPGRLWDFLIQKVDLPTSKRWQDISKKELNRLTNVLVNDIYQVEGKTTFKEEFVTAGGVSLDEVDFNTMESRKVPGLYFAGEGLDIDGITGGFNFQAAWSTAFVAGKLGKQ